MKRIVNKQYEIQGISPFTWTWELPDCVKVLSDSMSGNILSVTFEFCDDSCLLNYNTVTLLVTDATGCDSEHPLIITLECNDLAFQNLTTPIVLSEDCADTCRIAFSAPVTKGGVTYTWTIDENVLELVSQARDEIEVTIKEGINLIGDLNTTIQVVVEDDKNCIIAASYDFTICVPSHAKETIATSCSDLVITTGWFTPAVVACTDYDIDWTTVTFTGLNATCAEIGQVEVEGQLCTGTDPTVETRENDIRVSFSDVYPIGLRTTTFTVKDCRGVPVTGTLCFNVVQCTDDPGGNGENLPPIASAAVFRYVFGCDDCDTNPYIALNSLTPQCKGPQIWFDLNDMTIGGNPSWTSFVFVPHAGQAITNGGKTISTAYGDFTYGDQDLNVVFTAAPGVTLTQYDYIEMVGNRVGDDISVISLRFDLYPATGCEDSVTTASNVEVCTLCGESSGIIDIGDSNPNADPNGFVLVNPGLSPDITVNVAGDTVEFIPADTVQGTFLYQYYYSGTPDSNTALIQLDVNCSANNNINVTLIPSLLSNLNVAGYLSDTSQNYPWFFDGFTTDLVSYTTGSFGVNSMPVTSYTVGQQITSGVGFSVDLSSALPGVYSFRYGANEACSSAIVVNIEVYDNSSWPDDMVVEYCETQGNINLDSIVANLPAGGTWSYLGNVQDVIDDFEGTMINPSVYGPGAFIFNYIFDNPDGLISNPGDGVMTLTVNVYANPANFLPVCLIKCSAGPDPETTPLCTNIGLYPTPDPLTGCEIDLYALYPDANEAALYVDFLPFSPIGLHINGVNTIVSVGDIVDMPGTWNYGNAPLGDYGFKLTYGGVCTKEVAIEVKLLQSVCQIEDAQNITACTGDAQFNLIDQLTQPVDCNLNEIGQLTLISEIIAGEGTPVYDLEAGTFNPVVPGQWVFEYTATVGDDDDCSACSATGQFTLTVTPLPGPGIPQPGSVCNDSSCIISVFPDMFISVQAEQGQVIYDGFSLQATGTPGAGGWGGTATYSVGDEIPGTIDFNGAAAGFYHFTNTVIDSNGCVASSSTIVQVVGNGSAGTPPAAASHCNDETTCVDLYASLTTPTPGGVWSVDFVPVTAGDTVNLATSSCDPGYYVNGDAATFDVEGQPAGVYTFTYSQSTPSPLYPIFDGCSACTTSTADIVITITEAQEAGTGESGAVCN